MVLMRRLTIEVDEGIAGWIERRRGAMSPEEFAAKAIDAYRAADDRATAVRMAHMHDEMTHRLDELQSRIQRLDRSLKERRVLHTVGGSR
jgi:predicted esterase YcpF (UPF0227 family)